MMSYPQTGNAGETAPADPLTAGGLRAFGQRLRDGSLTAETATIAYLDRIAALDGKIQAFRTVDRERAIAQARAIDAKRRAGIDLGPLMGVPAAVKEIFAIDGLPYGAGTALDLTDITPPQGPFISRLRDAGCVILGTTRTTEFAAATINVDKPMPWNPADMTVKRVCGGSSHGSAAAMKAGLCAFSVGSDTGGSVRLPAALCGVVGYKNTAGWWATQGVFALSPTLDSVGVFTRSADDAALIFGTLEAAPEETVPALSTLKLGRPRTYAFDRLDAPVQHAMEAAMARLSAAGVRIVEVETPDIAALMPDFATLLFGEFVAAMGMERLSAGKGSIDRVPWGRIETAFAISPAQIEAARASHRQAVDDAIARIDGVDALIYPTTPLVACATADVSTCEASAAWNIRAGSLTRPGNFFGQCGISIPVEAPGDLPVGLQLVGNPHDDRHLLTIARAVETIVRPYTSN